MIACSESSVKIKLIEYLQYFYYGMVFAIKKSVWETHGKVQGRHNHTYHSLTPVLSPLIQEVR